MYKINVYTILVLLLKTFSAVFFAHPIAQVIRCLKNPGVAGLNPDGGVTFYFFIFPNF